MSESEVREKINDEGGFGETLGGETREKVSELDTYLSNISLYYDEDTCKACGMCELLCPKDAIELGPSGAIGKGVSEIPSVNVDEEKCVLCGICDAICPFGAFELEIDGERELPVVDLEAFPELVKEFDRDPDKCVTCPWCADNCPNDAITVEKMIEGEIEIDTSKCPSNCTICMDICPCNAIQEKEGEEGTKELGVNENYCIYCGACMESCPVEGAITLKRDKIKTEDFKSPIWKRSKEKLTEEMTSKENKSKSKEKFSEIESIKNASEGEEKKKVAELDTLLTNFSLYYEVEKCRACRICEMVCPKDAIELGSLEIEDGIAELPSVNVDGEKCVLCGICDAICPFGAFELEIDGERELPVVDLEAFPELVKEFDRDFDKCATCPWCADNCPNDAITVEKMIEGEIEIDTSKCPLGCAVCLDICPCDAIYEPEAEEPWEDVDRIAVDENYCIYCGACVEACPVEGAITLKRENIKAGKLESLIWDRSREKLTEEMESSKIDESLEE